MCVRLTLLVADYLLWTGMCLFPTPKLIRWSPNRQCLRMCLIWKSVYCRCNCMSEDEIRRKQADLILMGLVSLQKEDIWSTSLVVQWLRRCLAMQGDDGSIPDWGTKIPHAAEQLSLQADQAHMPQLDSLCTATKIPCGTTKTQCSQINKYN